jgi:hypothetical protein
LRHIEWCARSIAENDTNIAFFIERGARLYSQIAGSAQVDVTQDHIARLRQANIELQSVIDAFKPATFQSQIKP